MCLVVPFEEGSRVRRARAEEGKRAYRIVGCHRYFVSWRRRRIAVQLIHPIHNSKTYVSWKHHVCSVKGCSFGCTVSPTSTPMLTHSITNDSPQHGPAKNTANQIPVRCIHTAQHGSHPGTSCPGNRVRAALGGVGPDPGRRTRSPESHIYG